MKAVVLGKNKDRILVETLANPDCGSCKACSHSRGGKILLVHSDREYDEGAIVEIAIEDSRLLAASFLAYGVPLFVFFLSLYLIYRLAAMSRFSNIAELISLFVSLAILALTYYMIHRSDAKRSRDGRFDARIVKEIQNKEEVCQL
ncbi:MAG: SoxR reducing system RseC family protein [Tissierellia bacterium]|nr:SoxR reducing system RseC family protein [Tissierellia bacterium]